jgi:RNA polymerase sigma-70 factor (ECF subfamily)
VLVEGIRRGERAVFETLYRRHLRAVRAVVRDQIQDPDEAAEVVQEIFARALESLPGLMHSERFRPWLLAIARHTAVDARRGRVRARPELLDAAEELPAPEPGPAELADVADMVAVVRRSVAVLSRRDATAVGLVALGFGVGDVAHALGIGHGAAKVALHRARRRLRAALLLDGRSPATWSSGRPVERPRAAPSKRSRIVAAHDPRPLLRGASGSGSPDRPSSANPRTSS